VSPLFTPWKKFAVSPAVTDSATGTIRKAHTDSVKPS